MKLIPYYTYRLVYTARQWIFLRFTGAGRFMLGLLAVSAVVGVDTNLAMVYQLFTFLGTVIGLAFLMTLRFRAPIGVQGVLPRFATNGRRFDYDLILVNKGRRVQTGLVLMEIFDDSRPTPADYYRGAAHGSPALKSSSKKWGFSLWAGLANKNRGAGAVSIALPPLHPGVPRHVRVSLTPTRRGRIRLTGLRIARCDPFGLCRASFFHSFPRSIMVLPKRYDLPPIHLGGTRRHHSGGVTLASSVGDTEEFVSLRDYRPGDPLQRIHWKSWAKTGKPIVKELQEEYFVRHVLILDTFLNTDESDAFEEAVSLAASFACTVRTQDSLLDLIFVGEDVFCFTSGRGLGRTDQILEVLAAVRPCGQKPFETIVSSILPRAATWSGCICLFLAWDGPRRNLVRQLRLMGLQVLVLVVAEPGGENLPEPDIMGDASENFHVLWAGEIEKGLAGI